MLSTRLRPLLALASVTAIAAAAVGAPTSVGATTSRSHARHDFVFHSGFSGPAGQRASSRKWTYQTGAGWNGGTQLQGYTDSAANAHLTGHGSLIIKAFGHRYESPDGQRARYTSARLISKQAFRYGTVSARIRLHGDQGAWPAFWTMGANYAKVGWPACGELDVMETLNDYPNLYGSLHGPYRGDDSHDTAYNQGKMITPAAPMNNRWHTYSARWTRSSVSFAIDGHVYSRVVRRDLPRNEVWALSGPQNIILNLAVGGMAGNAAAPGAFHASMTVAWVHVSRLGARG